MAKKVARRATEVMKTHGFSELLGDSRADNVVDAACAQRAPLVGCPKPVMLAATEQAGADLLQIAQEIGKELLRHPEALRALGLGVIRIEENVHPGSVELKMTADGEGGDAAAAYRPEAEQGQEQPVTILDLTLLVAGARQRERFVHQLDAEVERVPGGTSRSKRSSGWARAARRDLMRSSQRQSVVGAIRRAA